MSVKFFIFLNVFIAAIAGNVKLLFNGLYNQFISFFLLYITAYVVLFFAINKIRLFENMNLISKLLKIFIFVFIAVNLYYSSSGNRYFFLIYFALGNALFNTYLAHKVKDRKES